MDQVRDITGDKKLEDANLRVLEGPLSWGAISAVRPKRCTPLAESPLFEPASDPAGNLSGFVQGAWLQEGSSSPLVAIMAGEPVYAETITQYESVEAAEAALAAIAEAAPKCLDYTVAGADGSSPVEHREAKVQQDGSVAMFGDFGVFQMTQVGPFIVQVQANRGLDQSLEETDTMLDLQQAAVQQVQKLITRE